ncbi:hypothetical protein Tco_0220003, partial [Tanacetum coccineum]
LKVCESLKDVTRFALFHSVLLLPILSSEINGRNGVKRLAEGLRVTERCYAICIVPLSTLSSTPTTIMVAADLFKSYGDKLLESTTSNDVDQMILQLLLKASQDKKFVCEEYNTSCFRSLYDIM